MSNPICFYFQLNLDPYSRQVTFTPFNEFCIWSQVLTHRDMTKTVVYTNKPGSFTYLPKLNDLVEFRQLPADVWKEGDKTIVGCPPSWRCAHLADFFRYYYLVKHGGIYLDTDIIVLKSFSPLINSPYDLIIARETKYKVNCGALIANHAESGVFKHVLQNYYDDYRSKAWIYNSMNYLLTMIEDNPEAEKIRILQLETGFHYPNHQNLGDLLSEDSDDWGRISGGYSHHVCGNLATIKNGKGTRQRISEIITGKLTPNPAVYIDNLVMGIMQAYNAL